MHINKMMKKFYTIILITIFSLSQKLSFSQCTTNFLINPSFETPVQPNIGNNLTGAFTLGRWTMTGGPFNVIKTNGSAYSGGPDNAQNGNQYIDITSAAGTVYQDFTITCTTNITFGGYFARREVGGVDFTSFVEIINLSTNTVVGTSNILNFTNSTSQETWFNATGTITALPPGNYRYRATIADFCNFDNALLCLSTPCLLPIKFTNFNAAYSNCKTNLNWSVANQSNIKYFNVEYSKDGVNFTKISNTIFANNQLNFAFEHNTNSSKSYYRIKGVELNGEVTFSKIIVLNTNCGKNEITIYPNPTSDFVYISITNDKLSVAKIEVFDWSGKLLQVQKLQIGLNKINIENLPVGLYNFRLALNNEVIKHSILKN